MHIAIEGLDSETGRKQLNRLTVLYLKYLIIIAAVRKERILRRNLNDPDLKKKIFCDLQYDKLQNFLERCQIPHYRIDYSRISIAETAEAINQALKKAGVL